MCGCMVPHSLGENLPKALKDLAAIETSYTPITQFVFRFKYLNPPALLEGPSTL